MLNEPLAREVGRRRAVFEEHLDRLGVVWAIICSPANFQYLSGYQTPSWANRSRPMLLVCDSRRRWHAIVNAAEAAHIEARCPDTAAAPYLEPHPGASGQLEFVASAVDVAVRLAPPFGRAGLEWSSQFQVSLPPAAFDDLLRRTGAEPVDLAPIIWTMRSVKSQFEIERIRQAAQALDRAYSSFAARAEPAMSERDLHRLFLAAAGESGADWIGYVLVVAGARSPLLGGPTDQMWNDHDVLLMDAGLVCDGYWSDFWRLFGSKESVRTHDALYQRLVEVVEVERSLIGPGVQAAEIALGVERHLGTKHGGAYGRLGHGIGLDLTEPPSLHRDDWTKLEPGMTLCIEPSVRADDGRTLVAEEMILVTDTGCELISPAFPRQLVSPGDDRKSGRR